MCLVRQRWTCPHGVSGDSLTSQWDKRVYYTSSAPLGYLEYWVARCSPCGTAALIAIAEKTALANADTDRCEIPNCADTAQGAAA